MTESQSGDRGSAVPDRWLVLSVRAPPAGEEHLLAEGLIHLGGRAVEQVGERFVTHLPPPSDVEAFVREAEVTLRSYTSLDDLWIDWKWQPHEEWAELWKRGLEPRRVTDRIVVSPTWRDPEVREGDVVIRLDPGLAFGTAEHATTRGCLRLLDRWVSAGDRVADVGAGSAILSIAAAGLGARRVVALESDPYACRAARENVEANRAGRHVEVRELEVTPERLRGMAPFDGIVANIETGVLLPLLPGFRSVLRPGGWLILSGIPRGERNAVVRVAREEGMALQEEDREEGWWTGGLLREPQDE